MEDQQSKWKERFQSIVNSCQTEIKRTTSIGKKMLNASRTNTDIHHSYEEIGQLVVQQIKSGSLVWENEQLKLLMKKIEDSEKNLEKIEEELKIIKEQNKI